jgi:hypothetical protein
MTASLDDLLEVVSDAFDALDGLGVPDAKGGLALAVAGLRRLRDEPDAKEALESYLEIMKLSQADVAERLRSLGYSGATH